MTVLALDRDTRQKTMGAGIVSMILAVALVTGAAWMSLTGNLGPMGPASSEPPTVFTLGERVSTPFADYVSFETDFTASSPQYAIPTGLAGVIFSGEHGLSSEAKSRIVRDGFFAQSQDEYDQIYEVLQANDDDYRPSFLTSDAVLHAFHVLYDMALREMEVVTFWDLLGNLSESMLWQSYGQYEDAPEGRWRDAALRNVMFFSVAIRLMDNSSAIPATVEPEVDVVLNLMEEHSDMSDSWFQHYFEDFTQYVPRGHYTRCEELEKYFLAMMWFGRIGFRLQPNDIGLSVAESRERGKNETAQAILIALALQSEVEGLPTAVPGTDVWDAIYEPTVFFVGSSDDLTPSEYYNLTLDIWNGEPSLNELDDEAKLEEFIGDAFELRRPKILSSIVNETGDMSGIMGMRFMGQRFIPDSYILGQLVYDYVGANTDGFLRLMPKGLDVMSAFGSERAWALLESETHYENYTEQMMKLKSEIDGMPEDEWTSNLYYLWLYSLLPLLAEPTKGYPLFMKNESWVDKQLMTALGSWTELRHDTILYAKQSYTVTLTAMPSYPVKGGYVEPVPRVYARLASLSDMMLRGLESRVSVSEWITTRLESLRDFLLDLQSISIKELSGQSLNQTEIDRIQYCGGYLEWVSKMPSDVAWVSEADESMALVADVHTDPNNQEVLEEAVGNPMFIYVVVPIDGQLVLLRGATFSYYEFKQPMSERLTDEAWQSMLEQGDAPDMPDWVFSFVLDNTGALAFAPIGDSSFLCTGIRDRKRIE
ncbi:DUF3160 domain-containing protein [Candidatus Thorarchaeota archaeon]|nr:MAG: DUF3160 domain-containing protein [Candidatus Thorarchaeota archaeon]